MTQKTIQEALKIQAELDELLEKESDLYKKTYDNADKTIKIKRDGKILDVKEKALWQEVRTLGLNCDAGKALRKHYKKLFKVAEKRIKKNEELKNFQLKNFGFQYTEMSFGNFISLIDAIVDNKLQK